MRSVVVWFVVLVVLRLCCIVICSCVSSRCGSFCCVRDVLVCVGVCVCCCVLGCDVCGVGSLCVVFGLCVLLWLVWVVVGLCELRFVLLRCVIVCVCLCCVCVCGLT